MNRRGFTLVELIAMIVVLSILMVIAIPNISGILQKNRESMGVETVNQMVMGAKTKVNSKRAASPTGDNACVVLILDYIDSNHDLMTGVNEGDYDRLNSFVVIQRVDTGDDDGAGNKVYSYKYYVRLVEVKNGKYFLLDLVDYDDFSKEPALATQVSEISGIEGKTDDHSYVRDVINGSGKLDNNCSSVQAVYTS